MHLIIICATVTSAIILRLMAKNSSQDWTTRWDNTLGQFLLAPMLLMMTTLAVLVMGPHGQMIGLSTSKVSYFISILITIISFLVILSLSFQAWKSLQNIHQYPQITLDSTVAHLIPNPLLFCAQIGFWKPQLVVSKGLLETLSSEHLEAVLAHEQAHQRYRDTFWFFWLGCIRRITFWLPNTESLWQELLILREIRADRWAVQQVDSLILAEALLTVVSSPIHPSDNFCVGFGDMSDQRLEERIDAILDSSEWSESSHWWSWRWILISFLPLLLIPFHS